MSCEKTSATPRVLPVLQLNVLLLLSLGHFVTDLAAGALPVLLPVLQSTLQLSYGAAGIISLVFNVSSSVIQPLLGHWSDRVKSRWLIPAGCLLSTGGLALTGLVHSYWLVLATVFLCGLGSSAFHPEASKVSRLASSHRLTTGMSLFIVGGALGAATGSLSMAKLLALGTGAGVYFIIPGLITAFLYFIFRHKLPCDPGVIIKRKEGVTSDVPGRIIFPLTILILFIMVRSWTQAGLTHFMPLYYVNYLGKSPSYASSLLVSFMAAGALGTVLGGPLADRLGRKNSLVGSTALLIPLLLMFQFSTGMASLVILFVTGMVMVSTMATTLVIGQELLPHRIGVASGLMTGFAIGMGGIGVTLLGTVADYFSVPTAVWFMTLLPVPAFVLSLFLPPDNSRKGE